MKLECDICRVEEDIKLIPGTNLVSFSCGNERDLTRDELNLLFKKYGGER
jgi:hypothetical protein